MRFEDIYLIGVVAAFATLIVTLASAHIYVLLDPKVAPEIEHPASQTSESGRRDLAA